MPAFSKHPIFQMAKPVAEIDTSMESQSSIQSKNSVPAGKYKELAEKSK